MEFGALKPLLTALVLPPLGPLLIAALGLLLAIKRKRAGMALVVFSLALLWLLSCHGMAVWLSRTALPQFAPLSVAKLKSNKVQAIVVLGGGVLPEAPEYGESQLNAPSTARLRYGLWLARQSGLPVAFTGGMGWAANASQSLSEAEVAQRVARQDHGVTLRWLESQSRDTTGNARLLAPLLQRDGIQRIALVTHASHMPRSMIAFERTGLAVTPAPMGYILPRQSPLMEWLPSPHGLQASRELLHEWLGLAIGRILPI